MQPDALARPLHTCDPITPLLRLAVRLGTRLGSHGGEESSAACEQLGGGSDAPCVAKYCRYGVGGRVRKRSGEIEEVIEHGKNDMCLFDVPQGLQPIGGCQPTAAELL